MDVSRLSNEEQFIIVSLHQTEFMDVLAGKSICPICIDKIKACPVFSMVSPCGHTACSACFDRYMATLASSDGADKIICPVCRTSMDRHYICHINGTATSPDQILVHPGITDSTRCHVRFQVRKASDDDNNHNNNTCESARPPPKKKTRRDKWMKAKIAECERLDKSHRKAQARVDAIAGKLAACQQEIADALNEPLLDQSI